MQITTHTTLDELPEVFAPLWDPPRGSLLTSRAWLETYLNALREPGERLRVFAVGSDNNEPLAVVPALASRVYSDHVRSRVLRFHQPDAASYAAALAPGVDEHGVFTAVLDHVSSLAPAYDVVRMAPLDRPSARFDTVCAALRRGGFILQPYHMFTNRFERVSGQSSETYMAARPSRLRNTVNRRTRALQRSHRISLNVVTDEAALATALPDYEKVLAASWKRAELLLPVEYIRRAMTTAARHGALRLGLLHVDGKPAAAQFWLVSGGCGICYRLFFDERFRPLSVGTVLTWHVIRWLLDEDRVAELDFGIGADPYKQDWMRDSRERWGVAAFNRRTRRGLTGAARHVALQPVKRLLRWGWHRIRPASPGDE